MIHRKKKSFGNHKLTVCCSEFRSHFSSVNSMLLRFWFCKKTDGYQLKQVFTLHFLKLKWWIHSLNFAVVHRELVLLKGCLSREKLCVCVCLWTFAIIERNERQRIWRNSFFSTPVEYILMRIYTTKMWSKWLAVNKGGARGEAFTVWWFFQILRVGQHVASSLEGKQIELGFLCISIHTYYTYFVVCCMSSNKQF